MENIVIEGIVLGTQLYIISHLFWLSYKIGRLEAKICNGLRGGKGHDNN